MIGRVLRGEYKILDELGRGGFGTVYLANDRSQKLWAIKALTLDVTDQEQAQKVRELLDNEQKMLSWLSHPAIVSRREVFSERSQVYLVMEYVDGDDLHRILEREKRGLTPSLVTALAEQICEILAYLQSQKPHPIVFRDLKPSNLMLTRDGQIKLVDFGIARLARMAQEVDDDEPSPAPSLGGEKTEVLGLDRTVPVVGGEAFRRRTTEVLGVESRFLAQQFFGKIQDTTCMGTPGYAAPEQYAGSGMRSDPRADIYALGAIMFNLLTKEEPALMPIPIPVKGYLATEEALEAIIIRATSVNREQRFPTARAMAVALAKYRSTRPDGKLQDQVKALLGKSRAPVGSGLPPPKPANKSAPTPSERKSSPRTTAPPQAAPAEPGRRPLVLAAMASALVALVWLGFQGSSSPPSVKERISIHARGSSVQLSSSGELFVVIKVSESLTRETHLPPRDPDDARKYLRKLHDCMDALGPQARLRDDVDSFGRPGDINIQVDSNGATRSLVIPYRNEDPAQRRLLETCRQLTVGAGGQDPFPQAAK